MTNTNHKNEQIKRDFFDFLKGGGGFAEISVRAVAGAIWQYQLFSGHDDFANFNKSKAVAFIEWLEKRPSQTASGILSIVTRDNYIRRVRQFFAWLSGRPGYKSKILKSDIDYLRLSNKDAQIARYGKTKTMPTFEEAKRIIETIKIKYDVDRRDRALISLAFITGMRIAAIISLKMKSFDELQKIIDQNPGDGVHTKNSKRIRTTFFPIGWDDPERYFMEWYEYLKSKDFGPEDPIFPATLSGFGEKSLENRKNELGKDFWRGTGGARKIFENRCIDAKLPYFHPHSFRHLVVNIMSKKALTEEMKKAISLNLGHANVGTTFGAYGGYGNMTSEDATIIIQKLGATIGETGDKPTLSKEELAAIEVLVGRKL